MLLKQQRLCLPRSCWYTILPFLPLDQQFWFWKVLLRSFNWRTYYSFVIKYSNFRANLNLKVVWANLVAYLSFSWSHLLQFAEKVWAVISPSSSFTQIWNPQDIWWMSQVVHEVDKCQVWWGRKRKTCLGGMSKHKMKWSIFWILGKFCYHSDTIGASWLQLANC